VTKVNFGLTANSPRVLSEKWSSIQESGFTVESLGETLEGGQSFIWNRLQENSWVGVIGLTILKLRLTDNKLLWQSSNPQEFGHEQVSEYLWIDQSYNAAINQLPWRSDPVLHQCMKPLTGLRILQQPFDEVLFYFLLSPVKSIPQIKETGNQVAKEFGENLGHGLYSFPGWEALSEITESKFRELKFGYRAKNIFGTAQFLKRRPDWFETVKSMPYMDARKEVMQLPGVGEKIADCVLLFGASKMESFPIDTWIDKVLTNRYNLIGWSQSQKLDFARLHFGKFAGLAQQFFFSGERLGVFDKG
jgi:N-glycosylase/DNA lyase